MPETEAANLEATREKEPEIEITFYFTSHIVPADYAKLPELLETVDVYAPEAAGWDEDTEEMYNKVSMGTLDPARLGLPPTRMFELRALYNTKKLVIFIDIPEDSDLAQNAAHSMINAGTAMHLFQTGNLIEAIQILKSQIIEFADFNKEREKIILEQLRKKIEGLKIKPPFDKKTIKILVRLGAAHTGIFRDLGRSPLNAKISRVQAKKDLIFDSYTEMLRTIFAGKDLSLLTDEKIARALFEGVLHQLISKLATGSDESYAVCRRLASSLTLADLKNVSLALAKQPNHHEKILRHELSKLGVQLPRNRGELERILNKKLGRVIPLAGPAEETKQ